MTDKQIIIDTFNSAWNRKVATESSYGKLASKEVFENNNEDKQIIIDGCDVRGCDELYNGCCCDNGSFYCKDQPNCQFKLEKRGYKLEQITEFTPREELLETIAHLRVLNAELQSYNEQLKESQNIEIKENKFLRDQLKAKEQECEKKDKDIKFLLEKLDLSNNRIQDCELYWDKEKKNLKQQLDKLKAEKEELKKELFRLNSTIDFVKVTEHSAISKYKRFKQALIDIKELAGKMNEECFYGDFKCDECDFKNGCAYLTKKQILQKIGEVLDVR